MFESLFYEEEYQRGKLDYANGIAFSDNRCRLWGHGPARAWEKGWKDAHELRKRTRDDDERAAPEYSGSTSLDGDHPFWIALVILIGVIFLFPWSILLPILVLGWDTSIRLFRDIVVATLGFTLMIWYGLVIIILVATFVYALYGEFFA